MAGVTQLVRRIEAVRVELSAIQSAMAADAAALSGVSGGGIGNAPSESAADLAAARRDPEPVASADAAWEALWRAVEEVDNSWSETSATSIEWDDERLPEALIALRKAYWNHVEAGRPAIEAAIRGTEASETPPPGLDAETARRFVDWVRLWWNGSYVHSFQPSGSPEVAAEDFEDMERDLAALGIRLVADREPPCCDDKGGPYCRDTTGLSQCWPIADREPPQ